MRGQSHRSRKEHFDLFLSPIIVKVIYLYVWTLKSEEISTLDELFSLSLKNLPFEMCPQGLIVEIATVRKLTMKIQNMKNEA